MVYKTNSNNIEFRCPKKKERIEVQHKSEWHEVDREQTEVAIKDMGRHTVAADKD